MSVGIPTTAVSSTNLIEILGEAEKTASDSRKDNKITREIHHNKRMAMLDKNIGALKKQADQVGKAGLFNFIIGMVSSFLNIAAQVLNFVLPGVGPAIAQTVNNVIQSVLQGISQLNPFTKNASKAGVEAEKFKKLAEAQQYKFSMDDERIKANDDSQNMFKNRIERAIQDIQKAQEATIKV